MVPMQVRQMEELRQSLPAEHASVYVCKNTLLKVAIKQLGGWKTLRKIAKVSPCVWEWCGGFDGRNCRAKVRGSSWMRMASLRQ